MPSVAVGERVNLCDQAMMEANGNFIKSEGLVCNPELGVSQKYSDSFADLMKGTA